MAATMENMQKLMKKKDELESEIKALNEVLESQKGVGMKEPLVDTEGYPRADVDVYSVRHARHQVICLQNDHQALMKEIEEELYKIHAEARKEKEAAMETDQEVASSQQTEVDRLSPFAVIDKVDSGSPAEISRLHVGDEILQFGSITSKNFTSLQNIASVVMHSKGNSLTVKVRRGGTDLTLSLTPQAWSGRGLLGCNIVPKK